MKLNIRKRKKQIIGVLAITIASIVFILLYANWKIPHDTRIYLYDDVNSIPKQKAALVLGASKYLGNSTVINPYFKYRIQAAKELYNAGKVEVIVVSGDNSRKDYNEPKDMRDALISMGIPEKVIYLDYAGFRTLDSVVRMNEIFGQDSFIIVSQKFHNERAIFLAQYFGLKVYGYNAKDVSAQQNYLKTNIREKFARVKVFIDMIVGKEPKFLGEPIKI